MSPVRTRCPAAAAALGSVCVWIAAVQAALGPIHSPPGYAGAVGKASAEAAGGYSTDAALLLSTERSLDRGVVHAPGGPRDTGVCDPPVGGPEPIPCTTNGDCAGFGPETCGTNGFCDYPPITTCGSDDDCVGKGTGHCLGGICDDQHYHYCRDPGHTDEGEWNLTTNGCGLPEDWHNSGCSYDVWGSLSCGQTLCGTAMKDGSYRDSDWYKLVITEPTRVTVHATAEFDVVFGFAHNHGIDDCQVYDFYYWGGHYAYPDACVKDSSSACVHPGTWWIAVVPQWYQTIPCLDYELTVECEAPCHIACCSGDNVCVETDDDTCEQVYGQVAAADDCTPGLCAWGCPGQNKPCNSYTQVGNSVNNDVMNPAPSCGTGANVGTLWFWFTATHDSARVSTCNSVGTADDSVFALYAGDCTDTLTELACSEDGDCGAGSWLGVIDYCGLIIGDTYYIQLASWAPSAQGVYDLDITCPSWCPLPGACCLSDGSCIWVYLWQCSEQDGQYQGCGTVCLGDADSNGIDDACELGACCPAEGGCIPSGHDFCYDSLGGVDFIPGAQCPEQPGDFDPCAGACCRCIPNLPPPGCTWTCTEGPEAICLGTWYSMEECGDPGGEPPWFECPDEMTCSNYVWEGPPWHPEFDYDQQQAYCQLPSEDAVEGSTGAISDEDPWIAGGVQAQRAADDFVPLASGIEMVCWWGHYVDQDPNAPPPAPECNLENDQFTVTYYTDNNGCPGTVIGQYSQKDVPPTLTVTKTTVGWRNPNGHLVYEYEGTHAALTVSIGECYWLEIVNDTGPSSCAWAWDPAPYSEGNGYSVQEFGLPGPTAEWDCDPYDWGATDMNRHDLAWCLNVPNDPCDFCRELAPGDPEGEPVCYDEYVDTYNAGCNLCPEGEGCHTEAFTDITCGQLIRGTAGTYVGHPDCDTNSDCDPLEECIDGKCTGDTVNFRDTDWYKFALTETTDVRWCVYAEFPALTGIINTFAQHNCPPNPGWAALAVKATCVDFCARNQFLGAGTWYGYVATAALEGVPCGAEYEVCLDCNGQGCGYPTHPMCVDARSLKTHGGGVGKLSLNMGCSDSVEPRFGGIEELEIDLDDASATTEVIGVNCWPAAWTGSVPFDISDKVGNTVTIQFSPPLPDQTRCQIQLDCGATLCVRSSEGDANRSGETNTTDASQTKLRFGLIATEANAQFDLNCSGLINTTDYSQIKLRFGKSAPPCLGARSCKLHGPAGRLCADMNLSNRIEPRVAQIDTLEIDLEDASSFGGDVTVNCTSAWSGTVTHTGTVVNTVTLTFSPALPDQVYCVITLDCGVEICVRNCEGDVNESGSTGQGDVDTCYEHIGDPVGQANCRYDFNRSGVINSTDCAGIQARFGKVAPACP